MKKIFLILFVLLICVLVPVMANPITGSIGEGVGTGTNSTSVKYTLKPYDSNVDTFEIGFSTKPVQDFTEPELASPTIEMTVDEGTFVGSIPKDESAGTSLYLYWQIASKVANKSLKIKLTATAMSPAKEDAPAEGDLRKAFLNVTLSTTAGSSRESFEDGNAGSYTPVTTTGADTSVEQDILTYNTTNFTTGQCAGSREISLVTDSLYNIYSNAEGNTEYSGTLTATVTIQ